MPTVHLMIILERPLESSLLMRLTPAERGAGVDTVFLPIGHYLTRLQPSFRIHRISI